MEAINYVVLLFGVLSALVLLILVVQLRRRRQQRIRQAVPDTHRRDAARPRVRMIARRSGATTALWIASLSCCVCASFFTVFKVAFSIPYRPSVHVSCLVVLLFVALSVFLRNRYETQRKRFFQEVRSRGHLLCPDCHTSLMSSVESRQCRQCGYVYTNESLLDDWNDIEKIVLASEEPTHRNS